MMKKILLACGTGICTSTAVSAKLQRILDEKGLKGQYQIAQCKIAEVPMKSADFDLCIATTQVSGDVKCPFIMGVAFLTGMGLNPIIEKILTIFETK
ncbi:PTS system, galactitol-specific IIB component [Propionispira arboris]|uniref:PTS system, galactitol-specific IIB component n=1 Tax=Propionispira arboris TaxID=84035 RepID=A0A1H7CXP6_9FIRM|nr:PTS sugar transporter subunit IIB [Propionispira arboris]SEJ94493.1 PTS system, galactitol-specific IIB component [Propionispira arboris]